MLGIFGAYVSAHNASVAQQNMHFAIRERERLIRQSYEGPRHFKCAVWKWAVVPFPGTLSTMVMKR